MQLRPQAIGVTHGLLVVLMTLTIIGVGAQSSFAEDARSTGLHDRLPDEDPSCDFVNRAYERTFSGNFTARVYGLEPSGGIRLFGTDTYIGYSHYFRQRLGNWYLQYRVLRPTVEAVGAVFQNCSIATDSLYGGVPVKVYQVDWARNGYNAKAEVVISAATSKFIKSTRRFIGKPPYGFPVTLDIFDTHRERVKTPAKFIDLRLPTSDPTCVDVVEAYLNTRKGSGYRELIYQSINNGKIKEYMEIRHTAAGVYKRYSVSSTWEEHLSFTADPDTERYTSCTFVDMKNGLHYYSNWSDGEYVASAEVWLTRDQKHIAKVVRRYPPDGRKFPFSTAISIFDYNAKKAKPPAGVE